MWPVKGRAGGQVCLVRQRGGLGTMYSWLQRFKGKINEMTDPDSSRQHKKEQRHNL